MATKEEEKALKKKEKLENKDNRGNLPVPEPKGMKKLFKKVGIRLGIGVGVLAGLLPVGKAVNDKINEVTDDNNSKTEADMEKNDKEANDRLGRLITEAGIKNMNSDLEIETEPETEPETETLKEQLKVQTVNEIESAQNYKVTPKRENINIISNDKAKENVGLKGDQKTPTESVIESVENKGKPSEEIKIENITDNKETSSTNIGKDDNKKEEETTQIKLEFETKNENETKKPDVVLSVKEEDKDKVQIIEGENGEDVIDIGDVQDVTIDLDINSSEEQTTVEKEHDIIEPEDPFER